MQCAYIMVSFATIDLCLQYMRYDKQQMTHLGNICQIGVRISTPVTY